MILKGKDEYSSHEDESSREEDKENSKETYPCEGN